MKKYTIEDLRNGKCAVKNDGTLEELREVLKMAFPKDPTITIGSDSYYFRNEIQDILWVSCVGKIYMPSQSVKDFLEWTPKFGEYVLVRDNENEGWEKRIYLATIPQTKFPYNAVSIVSENEFNRGEDVSVMCWKQIKRLEEPQNLEITVTVNGKEISPSEISEETWNNLRKK